MRCLKIWTFILVFKALAGEIFALELRSGDIILIEMNCYACQVIADETGSPYSHSGVVIKKDSEVFVAQSLGDVHALKLETFLRYKTPNSEALVIRHQELIGKKIDQEILEIYKTYQGLPFDKKYLWDNFDPNGKEKLYCSEFITKLLNHFLVNQIEPTPMDYSRNWDYWFQYFGEAPPQGKLGNSPSSFYYNKHFKHIGFLD